MSLSSTHLKNGIPTLQRVARPKTGSELARTCSNAALSCSHRAWRLCPPGRQRTRESKSLGCERKSMMRRRGGKKDDLRLRRRGRGRGRRGGGEEGRRGGGEEGRRGGGEEGGGRRKDDLRRRRMSTQAKPKGGTP